MLKMSSIILSLLSCHTVFTTSIMRHKFSDNVLTTITKNIKIDTEDTSKLPIISGGFCATLCHNKVGVKVPPDKVTFKGKSMPHKEHGELGLVCTTCHTFGTHKDVKLK